MATATVETVSMPAAPEERWRPSGLGWAGRAGVLSGLGALLLWITATVPQFWADRIALAAIFAIIGLSLNIIMGYAGQVSLGHHAFVGLAAFVSARVVTESNQSFWVGLGAAVVSGAVSAGILGVVALRIKGLYLALITLAYGFVAVNSLFEIPSFTGGGAGMPAPRPGGFESDRAFAYLCLAFLALVLFIDWRLLRTKVGRAILALKHSEAVAASYGVNVTLYKVVAFVVSGALAGLAGSLFAHRVTTVVSADFTFQSALVWVLMVVVGGLGNRTGVVIGSAFFALAEYLVELIDPVTHFLEDTLNRTTAELMIIIGPALALLTIIQFPGGIAEQISPITRWLSGQRFSLHHRTGKSHPHPCGLKALRARLTSMREKA